MKQKKIPMRMCIGCRQMKPKRELVRLVRDADGTEESLGRSGCVEQPASAASRKTVKRRIVSL